MVRSSNGKPKKNTIPKFASKYFGDVFNSVVHHELRHVTKNPKTVKKWLEKMRLSMMQKVSVCSRNAFCSQDKSIEFYETELHKISLKIQQQTKEITQLESKLPNINIPNNHNVQPPTISSSIVSNAITALDHTSLLLTKTNKEIIDRTEAFQQTVSSVQQGWDAYQGTITEKKGDQIDLEEGPTKSLFEHLAANP
mmetsp:Transcript_8255/g.8421  ORF Transcript_8255/g.8421 Transcript_8255/m.8421 type:complete len:196 (+) Transcript_8255:224-811(+)